MNIKKKRNTSNDKKNVIFVALNILTVFMKKILLYLIFIIAVEGAAFAQNSIATGNKTLDKHLRSMGFFKRKYYVSQLFSVEKIKVDDNTVILNGVAKKELGTLNAGGSGKYVMFGVGTPISCNASGKYTIVDDVYGTNKRFIIALETYFAEIDSYIRTVEFGAINYANESMSNFIYKIGQNAEIPILFNRGKNAGTSGGEYQYNFESKKITKLSQLIELSAQLDKKK